MKSLGECSIKLISKHLGISFCINAVILFVAFQSVSLAGTDERIVAVNGRRIRSLRQLITAVENSNEEPYVLFKTISGRLIALDRQKVEADHPVILHTYQIATDRSADFKKPDGEQAGQIAAVIGRKLKEAVIDGKR